MENKYRDIRELTPKGIRCMIGGCPAVYGSLRELTLQKMMCGIGSCPSTYEAKREEREVYLIIGRVVNPIEAGLEGKVGEGEALIEVPKSLVDERRK